MLNMLQKLFIIILLVTGFAIAAEQGVVIHDADRIDDCCRLFSSRQLTAAHLMRADGRVVHSWYYPAQEKATSDFGGFGMTWHYAEMLPNGHLIAIIKDEMILELDWNSNLVWKARLRAHHDFARTADGHTIVVSRRDITSPWDAEKTIAMDELVEFNDQGDIVWRWRYEEHLKEIEKLVQQPLPPDAGFRDWPHINACEVLPDNPLAANDPRFARGNLLLCGRHSNTIFIVERESGRVVWAWGTGELQGPHMPTMLKNGNILIFDNGQHLKSNSRGYSRVLEIDPCSGDILWQYVADPRDSFFSPSRGSANRLANGNTLIAESNNGRLFEVTPDGDVVWEYWNADRKTDGTRMPLYRVVPYDKELVDGLLAAHGIEADVAPKMQESLKFEKLGPEHQYKRYLREVVFYCELGYFDHALTFLDQFMQVFPNDPEGWYGYAVAHSARKNPARAFEFAQKAIDGGLPIDRFTCGLGGLLEPLLQYPAFRAMVDSLGGPLVHGPMLGSVTDSSAKIWLRTRGQSEVSIRAREMGAANFDLLSETSTTTMDSDFTAALELAQLKPSMTYEYQIVIDGIPQAAIYSLTTVPQKNRGVLFSLGFGGGAGATPKFERMWDTINSHNLQLFLLLGDNVYIDHPLRPITQKFCYTRRQSRPEFRRLSARTPIYAIWDDHDFTFNDGKGSPDVDDPPWKKQVWRLFKNQWVNPAYGGGETQPGCWFDFYYGDVHFIMLDCRYYREQPKNNPAASMLGAAQKHWLFETLQKEATFTMLASSVPWAQGTKPGSLDTWDGHPQEREEILSFIEENRIEGVVLLSADRHRSDAWKIERPNGYNFYEFESSKLTNIHTHKIMPGSLFGYNKKCSFGQLDFDTTTDDPHVTYRIFSIDNEEVYDLTVKKSELMFK